MLLFSYSVGSAHLADTMIDFLRTMTWYFFFMAIGAPSTFLFQGVGKGLTAMFQTVQRTVIFSIICAYLFAIVFGLGEHGVWYGIIVGQTIASIITYLWANEYVKRLIKRSY